MFRFYSWIYSLSPKKILSIIVTDSVFQMLQEKKPNISCWTQVLGFPLPPCVAGDPVPSSVLPGPHWWETPRREQRPLPSLRALWLCWILLHSSVYLPSLLKLCLRVGTSMRLDSPVLSSQLWEGFLQPEAEERGLSPQVSLLTALTPQGVSRIMFSKAHSIGQLDETILKNVFPG